MVPRFLPEPEMTPGTFSQSGLSQFGGVRTAGEWCLIHMSVIPGPPQSGPFVFLKVSVKSWPPHYDPMFRWNPRFFFMQD